MALILKLLILTVFLPVAFATVPLPDNVVFAFEKCKSLGVDLDKGQLKESISSSFDLHCLKNLEKPTHFKCTFFSVDGKKITEEEFQGGSDLGIADLKSKDKKIKFLIGKKFASYTDPFDSKVCIGFYLFEKDALKQKAKAN